MSEKIVAQGAEAKIYLKKEIIIKKRISKSYRLPLLDKKIRKSRTKKEISLLQKASNLIPTPKILNSSEFEIYLEEIKGTRLSLFLEKLDYKKIMKDLASNLSKLHSNDIIHGDLTTSNMIFSNNKLYIIDYGLGYISSKIENKAVDLHVLKEALEAKHHTIKQECWETLIKNYKIPEVIKHLEKVESRGRYKAQY